MSGKKIMWLIILNEGMLCLGWRSVWMAENTGGGGLKFTIQLFVGQKRAVIVDRNSGLNELIPFVSSTSLLLQQHQELLQPQPLLSHELCNEWSGVTAIIPSWIKFEFMRFSQTKTGNLFRFSTTLIVIANQNVKMFKMSIGWKEGGWTMGQTKSWKIYTQLEKYNKFAFG